jgi:hypothetical protein
VVFLLDLPSGNGLDIIGDLIQKQLEKEESGDSSDLFQESKDTLAEIITKIAEEG